MRGLFSQGPPGSGSAARRNVVLLGITSFFTDISSEMLTSILPVYLVLHMQLSPAAFGALDGIHQGGASLARLLSGFLTDRSRRYKRIAALGYGLSALCKLGLLASRSAASFGAILLLDRVGKGVRTSPRDALISLSVQRGSLGSAFGLHRALDTAGAMLGPLVAFALLRYLPDAYDVVFVTSFLVALLGVAVLVSFVEDPRRLPAPAERIRWQDVRLLLGERRFRTLALCAGGLGMTTVSDGFLYLVLQHRLQFSAGTIPLLYVATPAVFMLLALPFGRSADRLGRTRMVLLGYGLLPLVYLAALSPLPSLPALALTVGLLGAHYAATDGVLMALSSSVLREEVRGTGLSLVTTLNNLGRLLASVAFGLVWVQYGEGTALLAFGAGAVLALVVATAALRGSLTQGANASAGAR